MKKAILVDGNNLLFRSYYATAYSGGFMQNSKGFPTNAIYGFISMLNKIVEEENPEYMAVAFDIGKNFRHEMYTDYKAGRTKMPDELRLQFPVAKKIVEAMGYVVLEKEGYEADDIIGTLVKMAVQDQDFNATIVSSDKDLLQLINFETDVKLLKKEGFIRYNEETFKNDYKIDPINIIDFKALAGDKSDNIPGVKGIGEKTALKYLEEYKTIEKLYENIDNIKGSTHDKLLVDKENAFFSKKLATIYCDVPLNISLDDIKIKKKNIESLIHIYEELEFYSHLKKLKGNNIVIDTNYKIINDINDFNICSPCSFYIECNKLNYHDANVVGCAFTDKNNTYFIDDKLLKDAFLKVKEYELYTYDYKKSINLLKKYNIELKNVTYDLMIVAYLLELTNKDDIAYLMNPLGYEVEFYEKLLKNKFDNIMENQNCISLKSKFIFDTKEEYLKKLASENMLELYNTIEHPLIPILAQMEIDGVKVDAKILSDVGDDIRVKVDILANEIYKMAGTEFNISSFRQLGHVLFDIMKLPYNKKKVNNYKTDAKTLNKLINVHPIISKILEYRNILKLLNTYVDSLPNHIASDGRIHTIYKQNLTRTGRLSSIEPNLQNLPIRDEIGRKIRKSFIPSNDIFISSDYSQIELRILAHFTNSKELIEAFNNDEDIHTKVASDIFDVDKQAVTKKMRRTAKAVIFGIVYGISGFGLGENLDISFVEAKKFIDKYLQLYPGIKNYMDNEVEKAKKDGYVVTLFNRKRIIDELKNPNYMIRSMGERMALNTPIQGTGADILKMAMIKINNEFKKNNLQSKMILQIHDELIFDCLDSEKELVYKIVRNVMENVCDLKVPLKVEIDDGRDLYEVK